ncbi:MAG: UDP-N-acetylglucosamine 2-epimerase [Promethearchaeota archaeon]
MRKVCVITGTRAEYGLLAPIMARVRDSPKLELQVIATGMHLCHEFGNTYEEIEKDGFRVDKKVDMLLCSDTNLSMVKSVGLGILGLSQAIEDLDPDFVVVLGDRTEAFAGAVAGAFLRKVVCHLHGGDSSRAGLDDYMRHAITKFAHLHFTATRKSYERVVKLGEDPKRVFLTGAPGLDEILSGKFHSREEVEVFLGIDPGEPYILVVQHPVSTQAEEAKNQIWETIKAVKKFPAKTVCVLPNSDAGGRAIIEELEKLRGDPRFILYESLSRRWYLSLLKHCKVLVGNSSSGIIEAPSLHIPVVNVGIRQEGRERAENVLDAPHDGDRIAEAIKKCLFDEEFLEVVRNCSNPYGDGTASEKMVRVLESFEITEDLFHKKITY